MTTDSQTTATPAKPRVSLVQKAKAAVEAKARKRFDEALLDLAEAFGKDGARNVLVEADAKLAA